MKKEHHYMLWAIVLIAAFLAFQYHKRAIAAAGMTAQNAGGGIVVPGVPA